MENVVLSVFVNAMMAVLLLVTIVYCWRLNNRIRLLQDSRSELARIIREFNESTERATQSIAEIHKATDRISENIQHKIDKANFLVTDLDLMIEKGSRLSGARPDAAPAAATVRQGGNRVIDQVGRSPRATESALSAAQGNVASLTPRADGEPSAPARPAATRRPRSRSEQELMSMLQKNEKNG